MNSSGSEYSEISDSDNSFASRFPRSKPRKGTTNKGQEFEILVPALFSLIFYDNPTIKDFVLASNVDGFGNFDDLLISLQKTDDSEELYAFQLKHKEDQNVKFNPAEVERAKDDFGILKYCEGFTKIADRKGYRFIIYTNAYPDPNNLGNVRKFDMVRDGRCPGKQYFYSPATNNAHIYHFRVNKETVFTTTATKDVYNEFFENFSFYTYQKNWLDVQRAIVDKFINIFNSSETVALNYIDIFKHWKLHQFTNLKLSREELKFKILDLILSPHIITPLPNKDNEKFRLLERAIKIFDATILRDLDEEFVKKLISIGGFNENDDIIRLGKDLKFLTKDIKESNFVNSKLEEIKHKIGYYQREQPLIVNINESNKVPITTTIVKLKEKHNKIHVVLKGNEIEKNDFPDFTIFETLDDLRQIQPNIYHEIIKELKISLREREYTYEELFGFDEEFSRHITLKEIFQMLARTFILEDNKEQLSDPYIPRTVSTTLIKIESLDEIRKDLLVITCSDPKIIRLLQKVLSCRVFIKIEDHVKTMHTSKKLPVLFQEKQLSSEDFERICKKNAQKNIHHLEVYDEQFVEWIASHGNIEELKNCGIVRKTCVREAKMHERLRNKINVIVAPPGMGKSELLNYLKNECPCEFLPIKINLKEHNTFFRQQHTKGEEMVNHFLHQLSDDCILTKVKKKLTSNKKIMFFFDGLDELHWENIDNALDYIVKLSSMGFHVWLSSRPNLLDAIENKLSVFPVEIQKFTEEEQMNYVEKRLRRSANDPIVNKIFENFATILENRNILDVPLQLFMITEIVLQHSNEILTNMFVLTRMFRYFIMGRYRHFFIKGNCTHWDSLEQVLGDSISYRMEQYGIAALKSCLDETELRSLPLKHTRNKKFIEQIKKEGDFLGIISGISDDLVIFSHNINAEYFAALWLAENCQEIRSFLKTMLFKEKYIHIRLMFDTILAEDLPGHVAILYRNINELKKRVNEIHDTDKGGRTTLHLACSHGPRYPLINDFQHDIINDESIDNIRRTDHEHRMICDYLLKNGQDPLKLDDLFEWNSLEFADQSVCLLPLEMFLEKFGNTNDILQLNVIKQHKWMIFCYSALFGYTNLFKLMFQTNRLEDDQVKHLLLLALKSNNWKTVKLLLEERVEINSITRFGRTPLHLASWNGHIELVTFLLFKNADVTSRDHHERTPLHLAAANGHIRIIKTLIENGAKTDVVDKYGRTPLHLAVGEGREEVVRFLLDKTDVNKASWNGRSPLHLAVAEDHANIVKLLLDHKAIFNKMDDYGTKPLHLAAKTGDVATTEMLLAKSKKIDEPTIDGRTCLHLAAERGHVEVAEFLLKNGANFDAKDANGRSVLHWAVIGGHANIIELLLKEDKIDVNVVDNNGRNCLHWAAELGHYHIVEMLIEKKVNVRAKATNGSTALHWAANNRHNNIIAILLDKGADIDDTDTEGRTALHWAALEGHCETVQLLLEKNAQMVFIKGKSAQEFARIIRK